MCAREGCARAEVDALWRDGPHNAFRMFSYPNDLTLPRDWKILHFSSRHPVGNEAVFGQGDFNNYLGEVEGRKILAEMEGPGAIVRLWLTGGRSMGSNVLWFEMDGEAKLVIRLQDLVAGNRFPFLNPLVGQGSGGSFFSYVPMPFRTHCRVSMELKDGPANPHYYQIQAARFPDDRGVNPFMLPMDPEDEFSVAWAARNWKNPPNRERNRPLIPHPSFGGALTLFETAGAGVIRQLEIEFDPERKEDPARAILWVVDSGELQFTCPLGALSGLLSLETSPRTLFSVVESGRWRFLFPLVHHGPIRLFLTGAGDSVQAASIDWEPLPAEEALHHGRLRVGRAWSRTDGGDQVHLFGLRGKGHLAGVWMRVRGFSDPPFRRLTYLEGDERIVVDGNEASSLRGTGMEDFFNGAYYFADGVSTFPNHGVSHYDPGDADNGETELVMYRFMTTDAIPFESSLDFCWEIVPEWRDRLLEFESAAFWFDCSRRPNAPQWPDNLGWDLNRDEKVDARDLLIYGKGNRGFPPSPPSELPWPFSLARRWTGSLGRR